MRQTYMSGFAIDEAADVEEMQPSDEEMQRIEEEGYMLFNADRDRRRPASAMKGTMGPTLETELIDGDGQHEVNEDL